MSASSPSRPMNTSDHRRRAGSACMNMARISPISWRGFPPCRDLVYLPDVARLEQQINAALHSPVGGRPAGTEAFLDVAVRDYPRLRLPAAAVASLSRIPLARRSHLARPAGGAGGAVDLGEGGCRLEIRQRGEEVVFCRLEAPQFTLRRALLAGETLESAAARRAGRRSDASIWRWRCAGSWPKGSSPAFPSPASRFHPGDDCP